MKQITEDYVSYEIAKLLKEKGFEQIGCEKRYNLQGDLVSGFAYGPVAPTQSLTLKWLREVHKLIILVEYDIFTDEFYCYIRKKHSDYIIPTDSSNSYKQAIEAAILYVLKNLI